MRLQARLIDDLLDLTRVTRGKLDLEREDVDAHVLVRDAIEIANSSIAAKKITVSAHLNAREHYIQADSIRIHQVFWNLINNAVKFTDAGEIRVAARVHSQRQTMEFTVSDTGIGIASEQLPFLFDKFWQVDAARTRRSEDQPHRGAAR